MLDCTYALHTPALSLPEAAMLPALSARLQGSPANLHITTSHLEFRTGNVDGGGRIVDQLMRRQGTMVGRALLTYVKNAPAQRRGR